MRVEPVFFDLETLNGTLNGSNAAFRLSKAPSPGASLLLFRNGLFQKAGVDFTLNGAFCHISKKVRY